MNMDRICELAPSGKRCLWGDGTQCMSCAVHHLKAALLTMAKEILPVKNGRDIYECPMFEEDIL